ncbi:hypothetical protein Taro_024311 [Colocasia esculenta]|uniref:Uncharacterized protein n=1 Tax=Colocasia esculenta TaxID=4460 RepID=A0A843V619_COLES|nr:hypothetical protein [Colocasia esculenta]
MQHSILFLLSLGLLLAASSASSPAPVVDTDGDSLERGRQYYATFHIVGVPVAGLMLWPTNNSCPLHLDVSWFGQHSQPLAFFPEDPAENIIREGNTLYAMFVEPTQCSESTVWKLGSNGTITTGGTTSTSSDFHKSRFAISKFGNDQDEGYNFQYCPCSVGANRPSCNAPCHEGLEVNSAREKLPLRLRAKGNDYPSGFFFQKVKDVTNLQLLKA